MQASNGQSGIVIPASPIFLSHCLTSVHKGPSLPAHAQSELQRELQERGLPKSGTKAVLAERLSGALQEERQLLLSEQGEAREELQRQYRETLARYAHPHSLRISQ